MRGSLRQCGDSDNALSALYWHVTVAHRDRDSDADSDRALATLPSPFTRSWSRWGWQLQVAPSEGLRQSSSGKYSLTTS